MKGAQKLSVFCRLRWSAALVLGLSLPLWVVSATEPARLISAQDITQKLVSLDPTDTDTAADLANIALSLEAVTHIPQDVAHVLGPQVIGQGEADPIETQLTFALATFTGLGRLLAQDVSGRQDQLDDIFEKFETLLDHIPSATLAITFNMLYPNEPDTAPVALENTVFLTPLLSPSLSAQNIDFGYRLFHRLIQDLHDALTLPEAKQVINWLIGADAENTYKVGYFGYQLNLLAHLLLVNVNARIDDLVSAPLTPNNTNNNTNNRAALLATLAQIRGQYGASLMRLPDIFQSLMLTATAKMDASHIQTTAHACMRVGSTEMSEVLFTEHLMPLSLDGTEAWIHALISPDVFSQNALFTEANPAEYMDTLELIWNTYVEANRTHITQLCQAHPEPPQDVQAQEGQVQEEQRSLEDLWCIAEYGPGTLMELLTAMTLIESFKHQSAQDHMDIQPRSFRAALSAVVDFLTQQRQGEQTLQTFTFLDKVLNFGLASLKNTMATYTPEALDGVYASGTREDIEKDMERFPISILSERVKDESGSFTESAPTEKGEIRYLKIHPRQSLINFLNLLEPDGVQATADTIPDLWTQHLKPKMEALLLELFSSRTLGVFFAQHTAQAFSPDENGGGTIDAWYFPRAVRALSEEFSDSFAGAMLTYLSLIRDPDHQIIPFFKKLKEDVGNIYSTLDQRRFQRAVQNSFEIPVTSTLDEQPIPPYMHIRLSALPCEEASYRADLTPAQFTKITQDPLLTLQEAQKPREEQDTLNTLVVPETDNFVNALYSSLELKLYGPQESAQRLIYMPVIPPTLRSDRNRLLAKNPQIQALIDSAMAGEEEAGAKDITKDIVGDLIRGILDAGSWEMKKAAFAAYQDPHRLPVVYKDAFWPKPELGFPPNVQDKLSELFRKTAQENFSDALKNSAENSSGLATQLIQLQPEKQPEQPTKFSLIFGKPESRARDLLVVDTDSVFLIGDVFRKLLLTQLNHDGLVSYAYPTFIEPQILRNSVFYTALHMRRSQEMQDLLAEFDDHPQIDILREHIRQSIVAPIRSLVLTYENLFGPGSAQTSIAFAPHIQNKINSLSQGIPLDLLNLGSANLIQIGNISQTLSTALQRICSQHLMSVFPSLIEFADIQDSELMLDAVDWLKYFRAYHLKNPIEPGDILTLSLPANLSPADQGAMVARMRRLLSTFDAMLTVELSGQQLTARMRHTSHYALQDFLTAARADFSIVLPETVTEGGR